MFPLLNSKHNKNIIGMNGIVRRHHTKGERNTWRERTYPSEHTKESRRSGLGQKRIRFLTTLYGIFQYVYGAINHLEEVVDAAGKQARYQYNGLGHRVGKAGRCLSKRKTGEAGSTEKDRHGDWKQPSDHLYPGSDQTVL